MKATLVFVALVAAMALAIKTDYVSQFEAFKATYGRKYATPAEEAKRLGIFVDNMKTAAKLQALNPHATFGVNEFADMSAAEFKTRHNGERQFTAMQARRKPVADLYTAEQIKAAGSSAIDWRAKGAVTYVKNQGQCGSCWSFSSTGSIEGQWFLAGNQLVAVSEQELVSCDTTDDGCNGGLMDNAWSWLVSNQGGQIVTETSYPYVSGDGSVPACSIPSNSVGATISGHQDLPKSESQMATWMLAHGPISIGVDATSWQTYTGGIMTNCISSQVDHGVLAVGFDDNNNPPYWIVKNSWGASWGENGYIRVEKGTDQCLITSGPCTSVVTAGPPGPTPPTPPTPPGPTPQPPTPPTPPGPSGTFTQYICDDWLCTEGCQENTFPQNQCLQLSSGGSAIAVCVTDGLQLSIYSSSDCSGTPQTEVDPVNQCVADSDGTYVYNVCSGSSSSSTSHASSSSAASSSSGFDKPLTSRKAPANAKFQLTKTMQQKLRASK